MPFKSATARVIAAVLILAAFLAIERGVTLLTADTASVTVEPEQAYGGDTIRVTLSGFAENYYLPAGAVEVGGVRLPLPGIFGQPGSRAQTDNEGRVTFRTTLPFEVPAGVQTVVVGSADGKTQNSTDIEVLTPVLSVFPNPAVPNQMVTITGSGFTPSTIRGGEGPLNSHQITGEGKSIVSFTGTALGRTYADYPINLDTDGGLYARVRVPTSYISQSGGSVEVEIRDGFGRSGKTSLGFRIPEIIADPPISGSGSTVTVSGYGFVASDVADSGCKKVDVSYNSTKLTTANLGPSGGFTAQVIVPADVTAASINTVTASMTGCVGNASATVKHTLPARDATLTPSLVLAGEAITVTGISQRAHTSVSQADIDGVWDELGVATTAPTSVLPSPAPKVDANGVYSFTFTVPALSAARHSLKLTAGGNTVTKYFVVYEQPVLLTPAPTFTPIPTATPVPRPTPTPGPPAAVESATALSEVKHNLVRAWSPSNVTGWTFYDPKEEFEGLYTLTHLVPGRILWLDLRADQTVALNGRERNLVLGWNLVRW